MEYDIKKLRHNFREALAFENELGANPKDYKLKDFAMFFDGLGAYREDDGTFSFINDGFIRVSNYLFLVGFLIDKVECRMRGVFTAEQLRCMVDFVDQDVLFGYTYCFSDLIAKKSVYEFIENEGKHNHDLGDIKAFKKKISRINPVEFELFMNLIMENLRLFNDLKTSDMIESLKH